MKKTDAVDQTAPAEKSKASPGSDALVPNVLCRSIAAGGLFGLPKEFSDKTPRRFTADGPWLH
jgi:hypothetical protein